MLYTPQSPCDYTALTRRGGDDEIKAPLERVWWYYPVTNHYKRRDEEGDNDGDDAKAPIRSQCDSFIKPNH